jgi:class 3 adenylate cyclase
MSATRRLAAILAADVVGYSRLMGEDEAGTARAVREHREAATPIVRSHGGRIVKTMGDGVLLEFPSVVAAVECAIAIQKLMGERNAEVPGEKRIQYRIGVHIGDVLIEDEDIIGDGVNFAARLEGIAKPGAICLSEQAYWQVKGRLELAVTDLGQTPLKNIAEPVHAYLLEVGKPPSAKPLKTVIPRRHSLLVPLAIGIVALLVIASGASYLIGGDRTSTPALKALAPTEANHLSIAVLPFANLSGDASEDYFADGITENLTTELSRIRDSFRDRAQHRFHLQGQADRRQGDRQGTRRSLPS